MKILYLKLRNFIGIYNGMKRTEIELDLSKCKNKFILIVGKNGSGKSTILNALHPFSGNIEEKPTFIRPNKDGYKEIHIYNDQSIYIIKHFYKASKTGHNVKSYISQLDSNGDEIELNPNGNVESFLDNVLIHLKVDFKFLKLTTLGKNIINFIDYKAADRKKYIGHMLQDINAYEKYYKRVGETARKYQGIIKNISSKIDSINNKEHIDSALLHVENLLDEKTNLKENILTNIGYIQSIVEDIDSLDSILYNIERYELNQKELKKLEDVSNKDSKKYEKKIDDIQNNFITLKSNLNSIQQRIIELHEMKEKIEYQIDEKTELLNSSEEHEDIKILNKLKKEYLNKIKTFDKDFDNKNIIITKEELLTIETFIDNLSKNIEVLQSQYSVVNLNKCYVMGFNTLNEKCVDLKNKMNEKERAVLEKEVEVKNLIANRDKYNSLMSLRPKNCKIDSCAFLQDFVQFKNLDKIIPDEVNRLNLLKSDLNFLQDEYEFYSTCILAYNDINSILMNIEAYKELISRVPFLKILLNTTSFIKSIVVNSINFSEIRSKLYSLYSIVEDFEEYKLIKNEKLPKLEILLIENQRYDDIAQEISKLTIELRNIKMKIEQFELNKDTLDRDIEKLEGSLLQVKETYNDINRYNILSQEQNILEKEYKKYSNKIDLIQNTSKKIKEINKSLVLINNEISELTKRRDTLKHQKNTLKDLKEEKELLSKDFKDIYAIWDAVSNTKGIPLLFINIYLEETKNIANKLLQLSFDGEFYIDDFIINESEFRIPCTGRGEQNDDVQTASGGEKIMTSLAMSFALIQQSNYQYNVILLDEMDGELDKKNRKLFLYILEKQGTVINADQIFVVTHNNEFDSISADFILLNGHDLDSFTNKNIIFQY